MSSYSHNRLRQLKGLVTIDPWHEGNPILGDVTLHAYVSFDEGRLGGEAQDDIAFRMRLRKAEIKLLQSEPKSFEIDPAAIWRGDKDPSGKIVRKTQASTSSGRAKGLKIDAAGSGVKASANYAVNENEKNESVLEVETLESLKRISVSFQRNYRDQPSWILTPLADSPKVDGVGVLDGQPWDDKLQSLISMKPDKKLARQELLSSLCLCLICRVEDIVFFDIAVRGKDGRFCELPKCSPKGLVVEEYLKKSLIREGLPDADFASPFAILTLGEAVSEARGERE